MTAPWTKPRTSSEQYPRDMQPVANSVDYVFYLYTPNQPESQVPIFCFIKANSAPANARLHWPQALGLLPAAMFFITASPLPWKQLTIFSFLCREFRRPVPNHFFGCSRISNSPARPGSQRSSFCGLAKHALQRGCQFSFCCPAVLQPITDSTCKDNTFYSPTGLAAASCLLLSPQRSAPKNGAQFLGLGTHPVCCAQQQPDRRYSYHERCR